MTKLLSRDEFRELGFERDNHTCVWCKATNVKLDFHHSVERREFKAPQELGGYILSNGVSVCSECHLLAEMTVVSCEELRQAAGIEEVILPEHYYHDHTYTKWGDVVLEEGYNFNYLSEDLTKEEILKLKEQALSSGYQGFYFDW